MKQTLNCSMCLPDSLALLGIVTANQVAQCASPVDLDRHIEAAIARAGQAEPSPRGKEAIRALLRRGGFSPSGRNKPSSEYLAQAAREGRFPRINNLVDINNWLSLETGLPMSMLDRLAFADSMLVRYGVTGERYVFNAGGQEIDLAGLICICAGQDAASAIPRGNPVKDSLEAKIKADTSSLVCTLYATTELLTVAEMASLCGRLAGLLQQFGGATATAQAVLHVDQPEAQLVY